MGYHLKPKRRPPLRKTLAGAISLLALVIFFVDGVLASPPPVPRSKLPQIERNLQAKEPKVQLQALSDLVAIEGNLTSDLVRLLPRIIQLCQSPDDDVSHVERLMSDRQIRRVVVVDDAGEVVGMIAQADLARAAKRQQEPSPREMVDVLEKISRPGGA